MNGNSTIWTKSMISYLKKNWKTKTNKELADDLGLRITTTRTKLYEMGLRRMEMEYWTQVQINFLVRNYKTIGDKELAEIFNSKWHKDKGWSRKHIEKKRRYMKLKRTTKQKAAILARHTASGTYHRANKLRWKMKAAKNGTIRMWSYAKPVGKEYYENRRFPIIKVKGRWVHWARWAWKQQHGKIPKGMKVVFKDGNTRNVDIDNLELLSNADMARRNTAKANGNLSDNWVAWTLSYRNPELHKLLLEHGRHLIEIKRQQILLNRTIKNVTQ